jgi:hypothetical protein
MLLSDRLIGVVAAPLATVNLLPVLDVLIVVVVVVCLDG